MKKLSIYKIVIAVIFVVFITLPLLCIQWTGGEYSATEKRLLAPMPQIFLEDGTWNSNMGSELKSWFEDHIGFRDEFVKLSSSIKFNIFQQSPSEQVHIGKDGWYYYTMDENLQIATGDYTLPQGTLDQILENHLIIREKLAQRGIDYVIVLPPSKVSIYPEYLRYGDGEIKETPVDIVADYLEANSDLNVVRLKDALLKAKEEQQVFFKTDTHWNQVGAYIAYREMITKMNQWGLCSTSPIKAQFEDGTYVGEFGAMMGIDLPPERTQNTVIYNKNAVKNVPSDRYTALQAEGIQNPTFYYTNSSVDGPSVMMYGDSMFGGEWNVRELLAEHFSEFSYIWNWNINSNLLDAMSPDIVIYELTERYLNIFPYQNAGFLQSPLESYQAVIRSYQWDNFQLTVTVENTSSSIWKYVDQVKLGIFSNGQDSSLRATLPEGEHIESGDAITFTFSFEDWPQLLSTNLEVQMLQEGVCYFGPKEQVNIITEN